MAKRFLVVLTSASLLIAVVVLTPFDASHLLVGTWSLAPNQRPPAFNSCTFSKGGRIKCELIVGASEGRPVFGRWKQVDATHLHLTFGRESYVSTFSLLGDTLQVRLPGTKSNLSRFRRFHPYTGGPRIREASPSTRESRS